MCEERMLFNAPFAERVGWAKLSNFKLVFIGKFLSLSILSNTHKLRAKIVLIQKIFMTAVMTGVLIPGVGTCPGLPGPEFRAPD